MAVTLAITDNEDGTGGVATVSGVTGGTTTTVYYAVFTGVMQAYTWVSAGTVVGNGTLAVGLATGYYVWFATNDNAGAVTASNLVYQNLTNTDTEAVYFQILEAVANRIELLNLSGINASKIIKRWMPRERQETANPPVIVISPMGTEEDASKVMARDDVGYPVLVVMVDAANNDNVHQMNRNLLWREKIAKAIRNQRLPGVSEVYIGKIDYGSVIDPNSFMNNSWVSVLMFRFYTREQRGLT